MNLNAPDDQVVFDLFEYAKRRGLDARLLAVVGERYVDGGA